MNVTQTTNVAIDTSLDEMFHRMGELLQNISASRNGLADEIAAIREFRQLPEPGRGEQVDLTA
jgi:hypothetical protein